MSDNERAELTQEELDRQEAEPLPERTQMSVMHPGPQPVPVDFVPVESPVPPESI